MLRVFNIAIVAHNQRVVSVYDLGAFTLVGLNYSLPRTTCRSKFSYAHLPDVLKSGLYPRGLLWVLLLGVDLQTLD